MAQGLKNLSKKGQPSHKARKTHAKAHSKAKAAKKGNPTQIPKNIEMRALDLDRQRITKAINRNAEVISSARALRAGDTFSVRDIKAKGKELNRDIRRDELTRKKSRTEEKLAELTGQMEED